MCRSQALRELAPLKSNEARLTPGDTVRASSRIRCCSADETSYPTSITPHVAQVDVHYWASRRRRPSAGCLGDRGFAMAQMRRRDSIGSRRGSAGLLAAAIGGSTPTKVGSLLVLCPMQL